MNAQIYKNFLGVLLVLTISFFSSATTVLAESRSGDRVVVDTDEVINEDLFIGGKKVEILGEVNGDVYIGAENVEIQGLINGDIFVAAETITITGTLNDDIRAFGQSLTLVGATLNDGVTFFGDQLTHDSDTTVSGTVLFLGDTLLMNGLINGDIRGAGDTFTIKGEVTDSLYIASRVLNIEEGGVVNGDIRFASRNNVVVSPGAVVNGEIRRENISTSEWRGGWSWAEPVFAFVSFFGALVTGIVLLLIFHRPVVGVSERIRERPLLSLGVGSLVMLASLPFFLLLFLTIVGIPLALLGLTLFIIGLCLSKTFVALALGRFFLRTLSPRATKNPSAYLSFFVGLISLYLLYQLPILGSLVKLIVALLGLGALLYGLQRIRLDWISE